MEDLQERLASPTFSHSTKFYPRIEPSKCYSKLPSSTFDNEAPFKTVTKQELRKITQRLRKETKSTSSREEVTRKEKLVYASTDNK